MLVQYLLKQFIGKKKFLLRVLLEKLGPLDHQEKRVLLVFVEIMDLLEDKASEDLQDHRVAQETKEMVEKMAPR